MTAKGGCISPYRDFDVRSERHMKGSVGRTASFISTSNMSTSGVGGRHYSGTSAAGSYPQPQLRNNRSYNRSTSSNVYYTMNYSEEDDLDEDLLSPNRNQTSFACEYFYDLIED